MNTAAGERNATVPGKVWLVGAGPGDAELLTLKAVRVLRQSTVWLVDDLVGREIPRLARPGTKIIEVGKRGGCISTPQDFILGLMARYAREGRTVARVKGGDPFVFGRAGEEMAWLRERGIEAHGVNGITAGLAVAGALGLPLTHRAVSRGVTFVTAHTADDARPDWAALARSGLTIVCYMGMRDPGRFALELRDAGFAFDLPVTVAQYVSCPEQKQVFGILGRLAALVEAASIGSPAVIVLGQAVRHAQAAPRDDGRAGALFGLDVVGCAENTTQAIGGKPARR